MSSAQNIKCGWSSCSQQFGSEIDMNMHVMMNHMVLLEHGTFSLNQQTVGRKRPVRERSLETVEEPLPVAVQIKPEPVVVQVKPEPVFRPPMLPLPPKIARFSMEQKPVASLHSGGPPIQVPVIPIPVNLDIPVQSPWFGAGSVQVSDAQEVDGDNSNQSLNSGEEQFDLGLLNAPIKLSTVINEFIERLKPMKQLGFIRPSKTVYCVVCLKYVANYHECNWKHTPSEDRVAEIWFRRFGKERPNGKNQLMKDLEELRELILADEIGSALRAANQ